MATILKIFPTMYVSLDVNLKTHFLVFFTLLILFIKEDTTFCLTSGTSNIKKKFTSGAAT